MATSNRQEFDVQSLKISQVTVFNNRAEIKRVLETEVKTGDDGKTEIVVNNLPRSIFAESIRVDGKGAATIADVKFEEKRKDKKEWSEDRKKLEDLRTKRRLSCENADDLRCLLSAMESSIKMAHGMEADKNRSSWPTEANEAKKLRDQYLVDRKTHREQLTSIEAEIQQMDEQIRELERDESQITSRRVSVLLADVKEDGRIELTITYMVDRASWTPSYDIRVVDKKMTVIYYGLIKQDTGEKWNDVQIVLSTATPSVGGQIRQLRRSTIRASGRRNDGETMALADATPFLPQGAYLSRMPVRKMEVIRDALSASFKVPRQATIECDDAEHKMTIAHIDLTPTIEYGAVPCKESKAYVIAQVVNTSSYHLLAGPTSVYSGNSFICHGRLESTPPNGQFNCSLGVESGIKIEFKPFVEQTEKTGNIIFTSSSVVKSRERKIIVKNLRTDAITIVVKDRYPVSQDDQVKVSEKTVEGSPLDSFSKDNGLVEWKLRLLPGEEKTLTLKYKMEYPSGADLKESEE